VSHTAVWLFYRPDVKLDIGTMENITTMRLTEKAGGSLDGYLWFLKKYFVDILPKVIGIHIRIRISLKSWEFCDTLHFRRSESPDRVLISDLIQ
jgi:hypothetical protein